MLSNLGQSLILDRRYAEADRTFDRAIDQNPRWTSLYLQKAQNQLRWHGVERMLAVLEEGSWAPGLSDEQRSELREYAAWAQAETRRDRATQLELLRAQGDEADDGQFSYEPAALTRGLLELAAGRADRGRSAFEVARADLEERIAEDPGDARFHSALGIAYAGLGRADVAVREARLACDLVPPSREAWQALYLLENLALVSTMTGRQAEAIATLDELLARSGQWTPHVLRLDSSWDPLRDDPRFQALLTKHEVVD
jgi:serine/threonine-protein kinase